MTRPTVALRRRSGSAVWFLFLLTVLLTPVLSYFGGSQVALTPIDECLLALSVTAVATGVTIASHNGFGPLGTFLFCFEYGWLVLASAYQLHAGSAAWKDGNVFAVHSLITNALALNAAWLWAVLLGYWLGGSNWRAHATPAGARRHNWMPPSTLSTRFGFATLAAAFLLLPVVAHYAGGFHTLFTNRSELVDALANNNVSVQLSGGGLVALVRFVPAALATAASLDILRIWTSSPRPRRMSLNIGCMLSILALAVYANPLANTRFQFIAAFGSVLLLAFRPKSALIGRIAPFVFLGILLFVYPAGDYFRGTLSSTRSGWGGFNALGSIDFDGFQQNINAIAYANSHGYALGKYLFSAILFFVPRSWWHSKAIPASIDVSSARGYTFTNLSLPLQGELYLSGGILLVIVVGFAIGRIWRNLDRNWIAQRHLTMIVALLAVAQLGLLRGPLGAEVPVEGLALFIVGCREYVLRRRVRGVSLVDEVPAAGMQGALAAADPQAG